MSRTASSASRPRTCRRDSPNWPTRSRQMNKRISSLPCKLQNQENGARSAQNGNKHLKSNDNGTERNTHRRADIRLSVGDRRVTGALHLVQLIGHTSIIYKRPLQRATKTSEHRDGNVSKPWPPPRRYGTAIWVRHRTIPYHTIPSFLKRSPVGGAFFANKKRVSNEQRTDNSTLHPRGNRCRGGVLLDFRSLKIRRL